MGRRNPSSDDLVGVDDADQAFPTLAATPPPDQQSGHLASASTHPAMPRLLLHPIELAPIPLPFGCTIGHCPPASHRPSVITPDRQRRDRQLGGKCAAGDADPRVALVLAAPVCHDRSMSSPIRRKRGTPTVAIQVDIEPDVKEAIDAYMRAAQVPQWAIVEAAVRAGKPGPDGIPIGWDLPGHPKLDVDESGEVSA